MTRLGARRDQERGITYGPWLWGRGQDLVLFGGSALLSLVLVWLARVSGLSERAFPEWGFLVFVLAVDVAHVYSTLFRTYFDRAEVARHKLRYFGVPVLAYSLGLVAFSVSPLTFWRTVAYLAVFHFIRQQVGWVAVYRARSTLRGTLDRVIDEAAAYLATLYPLLHWHAHLDSTEFAWFVRGDFVDLGAMADRLLPFAQALWALSLCAFVARQVWVFFATRSVQLGKSVVVFGTAAVWYVGIVATNSDFEFTVTNVILHGVPYAALLYHYARARRRQCPEAFGSRIVAGGVGTFAGVLLLFSFVEEGLWDSLVYHERAWLFGGFRPVLSEAWLWLVVPLLAVPQITHYLLDGLLWRRSETRRHPAQRAALGFDGA